MSTIQALQHLTQFGTAGLMGALWLWERFYSRRREQELTQSHLRLIAQREELAVLIDLVRRNSEAIERFEQTQAKLVELIGRLSEGRRVA